MKQIKISEENPYSHSLSRWSLGQVSCSHVSALTLEELQVHRGMWTSLALPRERHRCWGGIEWVGLPWQDLGRPPQGMEVWTSESLSWWDQVRSPDRRVMCLKTQRSCQVDWGQDPTLVGSLAGAEAYKAWIACGAVHSKSWRFGGLTENRAVHWCVWKPGLGETGEGVLGK